MPKQRVSFKHRLEYLFLWLALALIRFSSQRMVKGWQRMLVFLLLKFDKKHLAIIESNLTAAFPQLSPEEIAALIKEIYSHFARVFLEAVHAFVRNDRSEIMKRVEVRNLETIENALKKNRGVVFFSAHFGNWELLSLVLSEKLNQKINMMARTMDNPLIESKVLQFREFMGGRIIPKKGALRKILVRLSQNEIAGIMIDQNTVRQEGVFVDFFSHPAATTPTVAQLHLKKGIPVVPLFVRFEETRIVFDVLGEIHFVRSGDLRNDVRRLTQEMTRIIEIQVRCFPEQWFWFHQRWKTRPQEGRP